MDKPPSSWGVDTPQNIQSVHPNNNSTPNEVPKFWLYRRQLHNRINSTTNDFSKQSSSLKRKSTVYFALRSWVTTSHWRTQLWQLCTILLNGIVSTCTGSMIWWWEEEEKFGLWRCCCRVSRFQWRVKFRNDVSYHPTFVATSPTRRDNQEDGQPMPLHKFALPLLLW